MRHGFITVAAATPKITVADCDANAKEIIRLITMAEGRGAKLIALPELCITGYTCGDLFLQQRLQRKAWESLLYIAAETKGLDIVSVVGLPVRHGGKLYNAAAILHKGKILGIVAKTNIPNYSEFYEARHFSKAPSGLSVIEWGGEEIPFGSGLLFESRNVPAFVLGVEICEDLWGVTPLSNNLALGGATVIVNPSASNETTGKSDYRKSLVSGQSARLLSAYIYAGAGEGESTTDLVFAGHNIIAENGIVLAEAGRFETGMIYADIDVERLLYERCRITTYQPEDGYQKIYFDFDITQTKLTRHFDKTPFVPGDPDGRKKRCDEIFSMQAHGLKKRLLHTNAKTAVIGISGGLDSTLALLVTAKAFSLLGLDHKRIAAVTMPAFGTTDRTYQNALSLARILGTTVREINISESVLKHFADIGHDCNSHDVVFENAQARERTQVLMDIANQMDGIVIGTGDLSEIALGWSTYNGDHMSMYAVNCSVPKTLVRHLVRYVIDESENEALKTVLGDILDTPVSPELLPTDGEITQKTEDIVGPYELHDFFLYYMVRFGYPPAKVYRVACLAFFGVYDEACILKWLKVYYKRFFAQQFKRSCIPDGPKIGSVALSPRGDWRMPSDASAAIWLKELEAL